MDRRSGREQTVGGRVKEFFDLLPRHPVNTLGPAE